jgi:hypothetical protein
MDAREHYTAAERWLEGGARAFTEDDDKEFGHFCVASAQAHALLAQAATQDPTLAIEDVAVYAAGRAEG